MAREQQGRQGRGTHRVEDEERANGPPGRVDVVDEGGGHEAAEAEEEDDQQAQGLRLALRDEEVACFMYAMRGEKQTP